MTMFTKHTVTQSLALKKRNYTKKSNSEINFKNEQLNSKMPADGMDVT